jgi:3-oxoacyl-[acyl-carrier protein] reductase
VTDWSGRVALVTGATRGIGFACAERLVSLGAAVAITGTSQAGADLACERLCESSPAAQVAGFAYDQGSPAAATELIRAVHRRFGQLDHVVANAGIHLAAPLGMIGDEALDRLMQVNAAGSVRLVQAAVKLLRRATSPSVVLVGSMMGRDGVAGQIAYSMSKAAVEGLVRPASRELGPSGTRVNAVLPGYIATDMSADLSDEARSDLVDRTPLRRLGHPADIAEAVVFLLSDESRFITGQCLGVDGGLTN